MKQNTKMNNKAIYNTLQLKRQAGTLTAADKEVLHRICKEHLVKEIILNIDVFNRLAACDCKTKEQA